MFSHVNFYYFLPRVEYEQAPLKYSILNKPIKHIKKITFEDLNNFINSFKFSNLNIVDQNQFLLEIKNSSCKQIECFDAYDDKGFPLYRDNHHLSNYGAKVFIEKLFKELSFN